MIVVNSQVCKCVSKKAKIKVGTWNMEFLLLSTKKFEDCQECQTVLSYLLFQLDQKWISRALFSTSKEPKVFSWLFSIISLFKGEASGMNIRIILKVKS